MRHRPVQTMQCPRPHATTGSRQHPAGAAHAARLILPPRTGAGVVRLTGRVLLCWVDVLLSVVWARRASAAMPAYAATWRSRQDRGRSRETKRPRRVSTLRGFDGSYRSLCTRRASVACEGAGPSPGTCRTFSHQAFMALPRERVVVCDNGSGVRGPAIHCTVPARRRRSSPTPLASNPQVPRWREDCVRRVGLHRPQLRGQATLGGCVCMWCHVWHRPANGRERL
jgi:hypothetical protein